MGFQKPPLPVGVAEGAASHHTGLKGPHTLVAQPLAGGEQGRHRAISGGVQKKTVHLRPAPLIALLIQHLLIKLVIGLKDHQLHLDRPGNAQALGRQGPLGLDIVVDRDRQGVEPLRPADVLQIE